MEIYLQWEVDAWKSLSSHLIAESFKTCGITNNPDGSEDNLIHCFKPHGPIPSGLAVLEERSTTTVKAPGVEPEEDHDGNEEVGVEVEVVEAGSDGTDYDSDE